MISRYVASLCLLQLCLVKSRTLRAKNSDKNTDHGVLGIEKSWMNILTEFEKTELETTRIYFDDWDEANGRSSDDGIISGFHHGQWMEYNNIDFGEEGDIKSIKFRYSKNSPGGGLLAIVDDERIGYIRPPRTGAWSAYRETSFAISGVSGVHTLRMSSMDLKNDIMNLDWFELSPYDVNRPDFEPLPCNDDMSLEASCYGESALSLSQLSSEAQGSEIFIECGQCAVADVVDGSEIDVTGIRVQGMLYFPSESNVIVRSKYIFVEGTLKIDPPDDIAGNKVQFYLHTNEDQYLIPHEHNQASCEYPYGDATLGCNMGNKVLAVAGGQLDIQALPEDSKDCSAWVKLESVDDEDPRILTVGVNATQCWGRRLGDEVMITNTNSIGGWDEQFVSEIESVDIESGTITLKEAPDDPATLISDGDLAAEVAWLSRSVVFEAEQTEVSRTYTGRSDCVTSRKRIEGGHLMIFHTPNVAQMIEGIELRNYGQESVLGRYPIHFHKCGDAPGSNVRKNVIRDSNQRCVVMHSSNEVLIDNNVAFGNRGHCFITEDGDEVNNVFLDNLGAKTNIIECSDHMDALLATDATASTFWITNPQNTFVGNVAAGSIKNGFWIEPISDDTASREFNITAFQDNIAHSNVNEGFKFYEGQYRPELESNYYNLKAYRNGGQGLRLHVNKNLRFEGLFLADNWAGITSFDEVSQIVLEDVTIIGLSERGRNKYPCETGEMSGIKFAVDPEYVQLDFRNLTISGFGDVPSGCNSLALRPWPMVPGDHDADGTILVGNDHRFHSMPLFSDLSVDTYENSFDIETSYIEEMGESNMVHFYFEDLSGYLQPNSEIGAFVADIDKGTTLLQNVCTPAGTRDDMAALFCPESACIRWTQIIYDSNYTLVIKSNEGETYVSSEQTSSPFNFARVDATSFVYEGWVPAGDYEIELRNEGGETVTPQYLYLDFGSEPSICSNFVTMTDFQNYLSLNACGESDGKCYVNEYYDYNNAQLCNNDSNICSFDNGVWIEFVVDFGEEGDTNSIIISYSKGNTGGSLEASVDGETIGTLYPTNTGGWSNYEETSFSVTGITGVKILRLEAVGTYGIMNFEWIELSAENGPSRHYAICGKSASRNNAYCDFSTEGLYLDTDYKAVRCCAADQLTNYGLKCTDLVPTVYGGSKLDGNCYEEKTWDEAKNLCENNGARLCTKDELESDCTMGTGCNFDHTIVWSSTSETEPAWLLW